jgi:Tfp pilus assembly protein PilV
MFKKKIGIVLLLLMCVVGFSMSPVCAKAYEYHVNGKVNDTFNFDTFNTNGIVYTTGDGCEAFDKTGLFTHTMVTEMNKVYTQYSSKYTYTAVRSGVATVKTDRWFWYDKNTYYFNITA